MMKRPEDRIMSTQVFFFFAKPDASFQQLAMAVAD